MFGDMMHMVAYPCLFWALRRERQIGVSLNSQILFFLSLLFRYATVVTETSEMLGTIPPTMTYGSQLAACIPADKLVIALLFVYIRLSYDPSFNRGACALLGCASNSPTPWMISPIRTQKYSKG